MITEGLSWQQEHNQSLSIDVMRRQSYSISVEQGILSRLPDLIDSTSNSDSIVIITDNNLGGIWLGKVLEILRAAGRQVETMVIPAGEASKSWPNAESLLSSLSSMNVRRRTMLVGLGGGVICDLVGFVAAVFMRGLPYFLVPTSLMGQLDAAIGGKTGIDFSNSKNLVGNFYHPAGVVVDPQFLTTLPAREFRNGVAEAVKVGVLFPSVFARLEHSGTDKFLDLHWLCELERDAIARKLELLQPDPFERSLRRLLNLGHTFGHAIEAVTGFKTYRHGEAVSIGIALAAAISRNRNLCADEVVERIITCLESYALPVTFPRGIETSCWREVDTVRRIRNGKLHEVLPLEIGNCTMVDDVSEDEFKAAVCDLSRWASPPLGKAGGGTV